MLFPFSWMHTTSRPTYSVGFTSTPGGVAEWLCSGLQSRGRRFDSDPRLHTARMVEQVDTRDLKSLASNGVPVRFRIRAPSGFPAVLPLAFQIPL